MIPKFCIVLLFGALAAGCSFGHSRNERPAQNYPTFIMSLYDNPTPAPRSGAPVAPMRVAVAQVGELAPPQAMLEHLRQNPAMFQRVEELSKGDDKITSYEVLLVTTGKKTIEVELEPKGKIIKETERKAKEPGEKK